MPLTIAHGRSPSGKIRGRLPYTDIAELLVSQPFDHSGIAALRHAIASAAGSAGLTGDRLEDFVVAVNEILTNAVRHGGGGGRVMVWREPDAVVCEVRDHGPGVPAEWMRNRARPSPEKPGGWGLWLAGRLTDSLELSIHDGTTVRMSSRVPQ
jgi:serine/threonine-protein kinase RsbW